jgi:hypothetical protein
MTARSEPDAYLDAAAAAELIAEAEAVDLLRARTAIARGVQAARDDWIPVHLIGDALAHELIALLQGTGAFVDSARYLRALADAVERTGGQPELQ